MIFVFGSNLQGIHGKGAALAARKEHGAQNGVGHGRTGNSYALPTKRTPWQSLPLPDISYYVTLFLVYAYEHPELEFNITNVGCGLAGYEPWDIAPLFKGYTKNCHFTKEFKEYLS